MVTELENLASVALQNLKAHALGRDLGTDAPVHDNFMGKQDSQALARKLLGYLEDTQLIPTEALTLNREESTSTRSGSI